MIPRLQFRLRRALLAVAWVPVWGLAYAVNDAIRITATMADPVRETPLMGVAMWPILGIIPYTALGTLLGDALAGTVVGAIVFSVACVLAMSMR